MRFGNLPGIIAAVVFSAHAAAGTYIEASRTDLRDPLRSPEVQKMWFDGGSFRLESERADAVEIFKDGTLYLIEPLRRRYTEFDESRLQALSGSPVQSAAAAQAAALRGPQPAGSEPDAPPPHTARATARTESSDGQTCTVWEITVGGEKVQELCVVPISAVRGGAAVLADMRQIGALVRDRRLGQSLGSSTAESWADLDAVGGIPIISRTFDNGHAIVEIRITAVRSEPVPFTAFDVPAGFRRRPLRKDGI
jgi:hypothetical protein